jgi:hypothetical protein
MTRSTTGRRLLVAVALIAAALVLPHAVGPDHSGVPLPARAQPAVAAGQTTSEADAERQHAALAEEDHRLLTLVGSIRPGSGPYVETVGGVDTLVLTAGGLAYGLPDLLALHAAETQPDGAVLLNVNVLVAPGARLAIDAPASAVRLRSEKSGFVSLVAWKAGLSLAGAEGAPLRVTSWDPARQRVDSDVVDGRAYIRDVSGDMWIRNVHASDLGFWSGRTSGVAWTGSARTVATGSIVGSTFSANHYGAFVSRGEDLRVTGSSFTANAVDGLSLHRSTAKATIRSSSARSNGRHGFSAGKGSEGLTFTDVTAAGNAAYGIYFDGTPLSKGGSVGGASLRSYGGIEIDGGLLRDNGKAALRVVDGHYVSVRGTWLMDNRDGIVLADTDAPTTVQGVVIAGGHRLGISVTGGYADVSKNRVVGAQTAIRVRDATAAVTDNVVARATNHAVSLVGAAEGSALVGNTISGRGPSGLDTHRLDPDSSVKEARNDVRGWTQDRDDWRYWATFIPNHPMLLLWVVLLGLPLAFAGPRGHRHIPLGAAPYPDGVRREHAAPLRVTAGRRVTIGGPG